MSTPDYTDAEKAVFDHPEFKAAIEDRDLFRNEAQEWRARYNRLMGGLVDMSMLLLRVTVDEMEPPAVPFHLKATPEAEEALRRAIDDAIQDGRIGGAPDRGIIA